MSTPPPPPEVRRINTDEIDFGKSEAAIMAVMHQEVQEQLERAKKTAAAGGKKDEKKAQDDHKNKNQVKK